MPNPPSDKNTTTHWYIVQRAKSIYDRNRGQLAPWLATAVSLAIEAKVITPQELQNFECMPLAGPLDCLIVGLLRRSNWPFRDLAGVIAALDDLGIKWRGDGKQFMSFLVTSQANT